MKGLLIAILFVSLAPNLSLADLNDSLVAYYPFNGNANDESGNGNHGTVYGATLTEDRNGNPESAYDFDGSSQYISVQTSPSLESPVNEFSFIAWVYIRGFSGEDAVLICKCNDATYNLQYRSLYKSNQYLYLGRNDNINVAGNISPVELDEWYHFAISWDGSIARFYKNGSIADSNFFVGDFLVNDHPLEIGRDTPGVTEYFNGKLDEIRLYNRSLNDDEIFSLFNDGTLNSPENIIISIYSDTVHISWDTVPGSSSYTVYKSSDPYAVKPWTEKVTDITITSWSEPSSGTKKFYYVIAAEQSDLLALHYPLQRRVRLSQVRQSCSLQFQFN